jgi:hypothetical protein
MQEVIKDNHILTINDVAAILRCSKTHVSHVLAGKTPAFRGSPTLLWAAESSSVGTGSTSGWRATSSNDRGKLVAPGLGGIK